MKIYTITQRGVSLARTTNNPDTDPWIVLHKMDELKRATPDQVALVSGLSIDKAMAALGTLRRNHLVEES